MSPGPGLLFVEHLTTMTWSKHIVPRLRPHPGGWQVLWLHAEPRALSFAASKARIFGAILEQLEFDSEDIRDDKGRLIWLRTYYEDIAEVLRYAIGEPMFAQALSRSADPAYRTWLLKRCLPGAGFVHPGSLWRAIYLVQVCLHRMRAAGCEQAVYLARNRVWQDALARYARSHGALEVEFCGGPESRLRDPVELIKPELRQLLGRARKLRRGDLSALKRTPDQAGVTRLAVSCYGHFNLDAPGLHSDFFFLQRSSFPTNRVLALFDLVSDPLDAQKQSVISDLGMDGLALRHDATRLRGPHVYQRLNLLASIGAAADLLLRPGDGVQQRWLNAETRIFDSRRARWRSLFASRLVRIYVTWLKYDAEHCAAFAALRDLGGILAVYQRSYEGSPSIQARTCADVVFAFSRDAARMERAIGSELGYCIVTGYLGDHRAMLARPQAELVRSKLTAFGARFVVAFFDENTFDDPKLGPGHQRARREYEFLLSRLLSDQSLGLVLKPKTPRTLRRRLGSVAHLLDQALETGRCHIFEAGQLQGSTPPVQAALAADLAIHASASAATAGVEAALAGVPTVLLDEDRWSDSPLYSLGLGQVVFQDWESLWDTLERYRASRADTPGFGDWSSGIRELDPFRDGRAAERMGEFLKTVLYAMDDGMGREQALAWAADSYAATWGRENVIKMGDRACP
jgi:hypothetical protein